MTARNERAVTITAWERAELLPAERDDAPLGPEEVAGRTLATLVSPGTEMAANYRGSHFPTVPGYAAVFTVEETGSAVAGLRHGDRAFCLGPHRSFQRVPAENALRLPEELCSEKALFARLMGISMSTLTTTTARPPQTVLVTGLGPVGHLAAQIFATCGYEVVACDPAQTRRAAAQRAGVARVLPAVPMDDPRFAGSVALAVECSGHEQAVLDACRMVRKRGEVVLVGVPWRRHTDRTAHDLLDAVFHRYVVLRSGWEWELPPQTTEFRTGSLFANFAAALRWLAQGRIPVEGLYTTAAPGDAQQVYQDLLHQRTDSLTAVFRWADG